MPSIAFALCLVTRYSNITAQVLTSPGWIQSKFLFNVDREIEQRGGRSSPICDKMQNNWVLSLSFFYLFLSTDNPQLSGVHNPLPDEPAVAVGGQALHYPRAQHHADRRGAPGHVLPRRAHHRHAARQREAAGSKGDDAGRQEVPL